jgi:tetratricopeptide (TPR) repeat protein
VIHRAVATALERSGEPARRGITLRAIGNAFVRLHEPENAIAHFRMALQCFDADEDPALPASIHLGLAKAADQQGRHEDSLMYALEALPLYRSAGNARTICRALNTVGYCYARTENYPAALDFCTEALELSATVDDPHGLAAIWDSLGYIHRGLGDFDAARDGFTRAIGMYAALDDLYQQADSLAHLGDSEEAAGRSESAQQCRLQAIEYLDQLGHPTAEHLRSRLHRSSEH